MRPPIVSDRHVSDDTRDVIPIPTVFDSAQVLARQFFVFLVAVVVDDAVVAVLFAMMSEATAPPAVPGVVPTNC